MVLEPPDLRTNCACNRHLSLQLVASGLDPLPTYLSMSSEYVFGNYTWPVALSQQQRSTQVYRRRKLSGGPAAARLRLRLRTNPGLRAPATTFRSSRGTGRVGVDTYLSRCRRGRAGRVLRVGVSVCGRWGCWAVDWGVVGVWCTACGRVRRATWSPSCLPCPLLSVSFASAVRAPCLSSSCRRPSSFRLLLACRLLLSPPSAPACPSPRAYPLRFFCVACSTRSCAAIPMHIMSLLRPPRGALPALSMYGTTLRLFSRRFVSS